MLRQLQDVRLAVYFAEEPPRGEGAPGGRRSSTRLPGVHELLRATSTQVAREERIGGHIEVSDSEGERNDEDEDEVEDDTAAPRFPSKELVVSVGPYQPIADYKVTPAPAETPGEWREIMRTNSPSGLASASPISSR